MAGNPELMVELKALTWSELVEHCTAILVRNGANPKAEPEMEPPRRCLECNHLMGRRPRGMRGRKPLYHRWCRDQMHLRRRRERRRARRRGNERRQRSAAPITEPQANDEEEERRCASAAMRGMTLRSGGGSTRLTLIVPSSGAA